MPYAPSSPTSTPYVDLDSVASSAKIRPPKSAAAASSSSSSSSSSSRSPTTSQQRPQAQMQVQPSAPLMTLLSLAPSSALRPDARESKD
jgi:hypothetical protein